MLLSKNGYKKSIYRATDASLISFYFVFIGEQNEIKIIEYTP